MDVLFMVPAPFIVVEMLLALVVVFKGNDPVMVDAITGRALVCMELLVMDIIHLIIKREIATKSLFIQEIYLFLTFISMSTHSINITKS
jgi:hypothetical protein